MKNKWFSSRGNSQFTSKLWTDNQPNTASQLTYTIFGIDRYLTPSRETVPLCKRPLFNLSKLGVAVLVSLAAEDVDAVAVVAGEVLHVGEGGRALL